MKNPLPFLKGTTKGDNDAIRQHQAYAQGAFVLDKSETKKVELSQMTPKKNDRCVTLPGKK